MSAPVATPVTTVPTPSALLVRPVPGRHDGPAAQPQGAARFADLLAAAGGTDPASTPDTPEADDVTSPADGTAQPDTTVTPTPPTPPVAVDPATLLAQLGAVAPPATPTPTATPAPGTTPTPPTGPPAPARADQPGTQPVAATAAPSVPVPAVATSPTPHATAGKPDLPVQQGDPAATAVARPRPAPGHPVDRPVQRPAGTTADAHETGAAYLAAVTTPTATHAADAVTAAAPAVRSAEPQPALVAAVTHLRSRGDGTHQLTAMLHPADLGAVHVRATLHGDHLTLVVACADDAARVAVTAALPDLHHQLGGLGSIDVHLGERQAGRDTPPRDTYGAADHGTRDHGRDGTDRDGTDRDPPPRARPTTPIDDAALDQWM